MANSTSSPATSTPGAASPAAHEKSRVYILHFRQGNMLQKKHFNFCGPLREAVMRAREHCDKMGYRHVWTRPFVVDLEHQEKLKATGYEGNVEDAFDEA